MIIKSATPGHGWRYTDHAEQVRVNRTTDRKSLNGCIFSVGDYFIEDFADCGEPGDDPCTTDYVLIDAALPGDRSFTLITNRAVYLLNDSGKTIERLN